jgi:hypothetical protein
MCLYVWNLLCRKTSTLISDVWEEGPEKDNWIREVVYNSRMEKSVYWGASSYYLNIQIMEDEWSRYVGSMGSTRNAYRILVKNVNRKTTLERCWDIKIELKDLYVRLPYLASSGGHYNKLPYKAGTFLTGWATLSFSERSITIPVTGRGGP